MNRVLWAALTATLLAASLSGQKVRLPRAKEPLTLCDFSKAEVVGRWTGLKCESVDVGGTPGMSFTFPKWEEGANEWPAVYLRHDDGRGYPAKDWSHYGKVALDAWTDGDKPGDLALELRDKAAQNGYAAHFAIAPATANHIELALADTSTEVNLEHIEEIVLYATRPARTYTVTIANLRLLPGEKPPLAAFDLVYPNYRGWIFPAVDHITVAATVSTEEYGARPADLTLAVSCRAGKEAISGRRSLKSRSAELSIPTKKLSRGPAELAATVLDARGQKLAERTWSLRKVTPAEVQDLAVYIDEHNNTIVEGKPFLPLGWYGGGSETQAAEIADSPFNCILDYGANHKPKGEMLAYLDLLQRKGLKLIYCMNDVYPTATYLAASGWEGLRGNDTIADAVVRAYRDHPAILGWYLNDELPRTLVPQLEGYYQRIRDADPNHPCYIVLCNMTELGYFTDTTDVMGVDPYPIPQSPVTRVSDWMEYANQAVRGHKPTWLVPQAFAWYQHHPPGSDRGRVPSEEDLRTGRAPTREEARCMTYLALAHGAKGLIYWCYYNMRVLPQYAEMWAWMKEIGGEVKTLSPALLSPEDLGTAQFTPPAAPLHTKVKRLDGRLYLIAVNAERTPCQVTFDLRRKLPAHVEVMFEDRQAPTEGTRLPASFDPLEVHVYDLGPAR